MRIVETITARGTGIALSRRDTTRWSATGERSETTTTWHVLGAASGGDHAFADEAQRTAFLDGLIASLTAVSPPETRELPHPFAALVGTSLSAMDDASGPVTLHFGPETLPLPTAPRIIRRHGALIEPGDPTYPDALAERLGRTLHAVDEILDRGLILEFSDGIRLEVPFAGASSGQAPDAAG